MTRIRQSVAVFKANKYVKRHKREKIIALLLLAIIIGSTNTLRETDYKFLLALLGDKDTPSRSTISRAMEKINTPLYRLFNEYATMLIRLNREFKARISIIKAAEIAIMDSKGIETKAKIARVGYINGRKRKGLKIKLVTLANVPILVFFTTANENDKNGLEDIIVEIANRLKKRDKLYLVFDKGFFDLKVMAKAYRLGIIVVVPYRSGTRFGTLVCMGWSKRACWWTYLRIINGVKIFLHVVEFPLRNERWAIVTTSPNALLAVELYRLRWSIEVIFRHISDLGFRLLGYSYHAFSVSVLLYLLALILLKLYAILARRRFSVAELRRKFRRWFEEVWKWWVFHLGLNVDRPPPVHYLSISNVVFSPRVGL